MVPEKQAREHSPKEREREREKRKIDRQFTTVPKNLTGPKTKRRKSKKKNLYFFLKRECERANEREEKGKENARKKRGRERGSLLGALKSG